MYASGLPASPNSAHCYFLTLNHKIIGIDKASHCYNVLDLLGYSMHKNSLLDDANSVTSDTVVEHVRLDENVYSYNEF